MSWWSALPAILAAVGLLFIPGILLVRVLGARGFTALAMAPIASCALVGLAGVVSGFFRFGWNSWLVAAVSILCIAAAHLYRRFSRYRGPTLGKPPRLPVRHAAIWTLAVATPAAIIGGLIVASMGRPDSFAQKYDNVFHLNAIEYILQTGDASSLTLGRMTSPNSLVAIYPSVWHSMCALIMQLAPANAMVAQNSLTLVASALIWPLAIVCLARALFGFRPVALVTAGVLSGSFWVFPYEFLAWGPLLPNLLSYTLLPGSLLLLAGIFRRLREPLLDPAGRIVMASLAILAFFFTQPNGFTSALVLAVPLIWQPWTRLLKTGLQAASSRTAAAWVLARWVLIPTVIFSIVWAALILRFDQWVPTRTTVQVLGDVMTGGLMGGQTTLVAVAFAACGVLVSLRSKTHMWLIASLGITMGLYWVAAAAPKGVIRHAIVGSWYQDTYRLAALIPIFSILLACVGTEWLTHLPVRQWAQNVLRARCARMVPQARPDGKREAPGGVYTVVATAFLLVSAMMGGAAGLATVAEDISHGFSFSEGRILTLDEYTLMQRIPELVPTDAVIAVNPFNGGTLAYAIAGRHVTEVNLAPGPDAEVLTLGHDFATAKAGSRTCRIAVAMNVRYILDFGNSYMTEKSQATDNYPGFVDVVPSKGTRLVDSQGAAKLYEVTTCTRAP